MRGLVALLAVVVACEQSPQEPPAPRVEPPAPALTNPVPPPPPVTPVTPTPPPKRPHTHVRRTTHLNDELPQHGIALHEYGIGGDDLVVIDADAKTLRYVDHRTLVDHKSKDATRPLTTAELARFTTLADATWREDPVGDTPRITDVRSYLEIADGDAVFVADGTRFEAPWRPAAGRLVEAIANASWARAHN